MLSKKNATASVLVDFDYSIPTNIKPLMNSLLLFPLIWFCIILYNQQEQGSSKTLIDNIYSNVVTPNNISSNITAPISDDFLQFFSAPDIFLVFFERDRSRFDQAIFIFDSLSLHEKNLIKPNNGNVDQTFDGFLTNFKSILDMYATLKRFVSKK